jgi:hydrogenase-4 component B
MEKLGGLIRRMPTTACCFLIGSMAISALPPLNGFASEWMIFQSLFGGFNVPAPGIAALMPVAVAALALTGGLAAACFVKAFGMTFLALPRSAEASQAGEASLSMRVAMTLMALATVVLGIAPFAVMPALKASVQSLPGLTLTYPGQAAFSTALTSVDGYTRVSPLWIACGLLGIGLLTFLALRVLRVSCGLRLSDPWGCGRTGQTARMEYTPTAFAEPLRRVFEELYRPSKELSIDFHPDSKYFVQSIEYRIQVVPWFERVLYWPLIRGVRVLASCVRRLQSGSVHLYLLYVVMALLLLLLTMRMR